MISVYFTCKDMKEAREIARSLLSKKLIACANIFPIESVYAWDGKIVEDSEVAVFCKAKPNYYAKIEAEIKKLHSYQIPCIVGFGWMFSNKKYREWVASS